MTMMNITLKRMGLVMLLLAAFAGTTAAYAQSRFQGSAFGYAVQDDSRQRFNQDRRGDDGQRQARERRDDYGADRNAGRQDQGRRDPRLSPDERRALRRQIDEAGRDIYAPRR
ncbi:hypothetical protein [Herminiimonas fonticola]|uniref:hypothetical protein n=1 Tax=Herminiimonas fonticola TaxID=303380 RepID=UPI00333E7624